MKAGPSEGALGVSWKARNMACTGHKGWLGILGKGIRNVLCLNCTVFDQAKFNTAPHE